MFDALKKMRGFTLVEVMIVVAIIALLAAIAIPNLLSARKTANEAAAKTNIKTLCVEAEVYAAGDGSGQYYADLTALQNNSAAAQKYCDNTSGGYAYTCEIVVDNYNFTAAPINANTGNKTFTGTNGGLITVQ